MAIWDRLFKRMIGPFIDESIEEVREQEKIEKGLSVMAPPWRFAPADTGNRTVDKAFPRGVKWNTLREFSRFYPILRSCINYRKRQITQLDWDVSPREVIKDKKKKEQFQDDAKKIKEFLKYPTGDRTLTLTGFVNKIIEDLLVLDAVAVYRRVDRAGDFYGYLPIDSSTIELILNKDGTIPVPPDEAYQQKIDGKVIAKLTIDELIYKMLNPRTESPYGLSPVEALIIVITTSLKLSSYNLSYLTEGNVPEGFVELPKDIASSPDQLKAWQEAWDNMFSGNPKFQRKIKFLPEGMKWSPIKKAEDMTYQRFEEWLLLNTCSVMEVPPQAIGFQFERGKGATEAEWEIGKERGLFPTANFLKELFDEVIQEDLEYPHLEFVWTNINPTNKKEEADVFGKLVTTGAVSVDEWRLGEGLDPIGCPHYIMTPIGPIFVKDFVERSESGQILLPQSYQVKEPKPQPKGSSVVPKIEKGLKMATREDIYEELKRWKRAATNDLKQNKPFRDFSTELIDFRTQKLIRDGLKVVTSKKDLDQLFAPFISHENKVLSAVLDLYDEVNSIANNGSPATKTDQGSN